MAIYIPLEVQLQWIRDDLEKIKSLLDIYSPSTSRPCCPDCGSVSCLEYPKCINKCPDCEFIKAHGLGDTKCSYHAPEFLMRIDFNENR